MPRPPDGFESAFEGLDAAARASFVAAVYEARGWESDRAGTAVVVRPPGDGGDAQYVVPAGATASVDTDEARRLDAAALREMVRYGLSSADRTRLCRRFFDRSPDEVGLTGGTEREEGSDARVGDSTTAGDAPDATADDPNAAGDTPDARVGDSITAGDAGARLLAALRTPSVVTVVLACAVAVALIASWSALPLGDSAGSSPAAEPFGDNASTGATTTPRHDGAATATELPDSDEFIEDSTLGRQAVLEQSYPPGVGIDGVENASMLAAAHRSTLSNRSYRLLVTNREFVDERPTAVAWERTVVETPASHRSTVRVAGAFRWPPSGVANASTYANGTTRVVRVGSDTDADGTVRFESPAAATRSASEPDTRVVGPAPDADPFAARTGSLLRRTLSGTETAVTGSFDRDGVAYFWIEISSRSAVADADGGTLLVDERGLVHEFRYARTVVSLDSTPVRRTVTFRVTPGPVTVTPPSWYHPDGADESG